ncbi:hypothetical protein [Streptomyces xiaopingdaonensis]|uniref:hypothetical protein n=1 Tax=Streptomyces xiaopingdaonensis TaxID=1565415 RepID=UPI0002E9FAF6|nr:hypothetical protein [Streptomyces xiaopingdaonensis]
MSSSLRRGTLAASALALSVSVLTACGAGNDAQTLQVKPDNPAATEGPVRIQNVHVVTDSEGSDQAVVNARIFNGSKSDQTLEGISMPGSGSTIRLEPGKGGKLVVPSGGSLAIGGEDNASALIEDAPGAGIRDGDNQTLSFELSSTGAVKVDASVVPAKHQYATSGPSISPSQQPSGSPSPGTQGNGAGEAGRQDDGAASGEEGTGSDAGQEQNEGAQHGG